MEAFPYEYRAFNVETVWMGAESGENGTTTPLHPQIQVYRAASRTKFVSMCVACVELYLPNVEDTVVDEETREAFLDAWKDHMETEEMAALNIGRVGDMPSCPSRVAQGTNYKAPRR